MVRHSALTSMFKFVIALLTALVFVGVGGVTVSAGAHDCGCQTDNSGPGSSGPDNSGPGNACHDNSGPGSTTSGSSGSDNGGSSGSDNSGSSETASSSGSSSGSNTGPSANSGPGNAEDDCPVDDGGGSSDPGAGQSTSGGGSGGQSAGASTVVLGAQASTGTQVPTAVNAGLTDSEESPSALAALAILLGLAMTFGALARRRTRV